MAPSGNQERLRLAVRIKCSSRHSRCIASTARTPCRPFGALPATSAHVQWFFTLAATLRGRFWCPRQAVDEVLAGRHVVVSTSTASGKSLCYALPVLEALAVDRSACAIFMFPTKALAQVSRRY